MPKPAPHFYLDDEVTRADYFQMIREIVTKYKDDERICIWDVYNEPGNSRRQNITLPIIKAIFELVREINPSQPLTSAPFRILGNESAPLCEVEQFALDNSNIISFHCYKNYAETVRQIRILKRYGRPIINTEWLSRCTHNDVFDIFPLFYIEKIGCYCWGFVAGKYQTFEPWNSVWQKYEDGTQTDVDLTKWLHDLYRPSHRPYDPREIKLIKEFCQLADADHAAKENV